MKTLSIPYNDEFIANLRKQKAALIAINEKEKSQDIEGVINLFDFMQDQLVDVNKEPENEVFSISDDENDCAPELSEFSIGDNRIELYHASMMSSSKPGHYLISVQFKLNQKYKEIAITSTDSRLFDGYRDSEDSFEYLVKNAHGTIYQVIESIIKQEA